jgi:hypothetical protein
MSFKRLTTLFRKKHKYETQADLAGMSVQEILSIHPNDVGFYIETETGGKPLPPGSVKWLALMNLLAYKSVYKEMRGRVNPNQRTEAIQKFLKRNGLVYDPEVEKLMLTANRELIKKTDMPDKTLDNRLRGLKGQSPLSLTQEEENQKMSARLNALYDKNELTEDELFERRLHALGDTKRGKGRRRRSTRRKRHSKRKTHRRRK